ncbi:anti-virulence regulator CigR family protein [Pseudomonas sp. NPDC089530]|uniref:anti-virulence regulator CigR family protein n=1 Tax=Pseudomonas sp. NPDC089530 TaxID=3390651 RepID=UPI003D05CFF1
MKMPKHLIAGLGVLMLSASPLLPAVADPRYDHDRGDPQQGRYDDGGDYRRDHRGDEHRGPQFDYRGGPPRDFGPVRQTIRDNHVYFVRGAPPPRGILLVRGQPLPRGYYGERLDNRALAHLPYYRGYEWRRMGADIVLIAVGSGVVYEILDNVLY